MYRPVMVSPSAFSPHRSLLARPAPTLRSPLADAIFPRLSFSDPNYKQHSDLQHVQLIERVTRMIFQSPERWLHHTLHSRLLQRSTRFNMES